jgi:hypothetical protein
LEDVDGYRCAIQFARQRGVPISALLSMNGGARQELIDDIALEYLQHAQWQVRQLQPAPPSWRAAREGEAAVCK